MKDLNEVNPDWTDRQLVTATSTLAHAASAIREDTLDTDITDRQANLVMLIGSRALIEANGVKLDPMTATRAMNHLINEFSVTDTTAESDIKRLKQLKIIECIQDPEDKRRRLLRLTESGMVLYRRLGERIANLVLAIGKLIERDGSIPDDPLENVRSFVRDFAIRIR